MINSVKSSPLLGALFLTTALLAFAIQDAIVKSLTTAYPVLQLLTVRIFFVLLFFLCVTGTITGWKILHTAHKGLLLLRGVIAFFAFGSYYLALAVVPMADASAVYMTAPLFITALSVPLLGEKVGIHRWGAVILGFLAVLLIINPTSALFRIEAALPLLSALFYSLIPVITRKVGLSAHVLAMTTYNAGAYLITCLLAVLLISLFPLSTEAPALLQTIAEPWKMPDGFSLWWMFVSAIIFSVAVLCITQAYRISSISALAPFEYSYLVWMITLGYLIFGEVPGFGTLAGAAVVVACGIYVVYRESRLATNEPM